MEEGSNSRSGGLRDVRWGLINAGNSHLNFARNPPPPPRSPTRRTAAGSLSADTHNMSDLADRLEVKVFAARDLVEAEGGECNPFAVVKCNMVRVKG